MPRFIVLRTYPGFVDASGIDFQEYPDDTSDEQLNNDAWQFALDWAEMYGVYYAPHYSKEDIENDSENTYSENIEGWWEEYDPEKHNRLTINGKCPF